MGHWLSPHRYGLHNALRLLRPVVSPVVEMASKRRLRSAANVADLRECARLRAHKMVFDYLDSGADDEIALRRAKDAYSEFDLHYNVLSGLEPPLDLSTTIFGRDVRLPFFTCPCAGNRMFHTEGEKAVAAAAQKHGTLYGLSTLGTTSVQEVGEINDGPKVFQLYVWKDRALVKDMLDMAKDKNYDALALTVDFTWYGNRERDIRNGFTIPPSYTLKQMTEAAKKPAWTWDFVSSDPYTYANLNKDVPADSLASFVNDQINPAYNWEDAAWLVQEWGGRTALKGVVRPDDATKALDIGASTIWISNHGGRQLETAPAPIDVLPAIREAVGPDVEIILDGGVQRGVDIVKGLALGADAVGIGKPYLYGLAAGGYEGVDKAITILHAELERAMGLLGTDTVDDLKRRGPDLVRRRPSSVRDYPSPGPRGCFGGETSGIW